MTRTSHKEAFQSDSHHSDLCFVHKRDPMRLEKASVFVPLGLFFKVMTFL